MLRDSSMTGDRRLAYLVIAFVLGAAFAGAAIYTVYTTEVSRLSSQVSQLHALIEELREKAYGPFPEEKPIAIISAFKGELEYLVKEINVTGSLKILEAKPWKFYYGEYKGKKVVLFYSGVGKTNAAAATELCIAKFRPKAIIFSGIAGGVPEFADVGDITISSAVLHHDYGLVIPIGGVPGVEYPATADLERGFVPNPVPLPQGTRIHMLNATPWLISLALNASRMVDFGVVPGTNRAPAVRVGVIVTGDQFIASTQKCEWLYSAFNALATEMEGAAVAQVAYINDVPWVVIRCHSDRADEVAQEIIAAFWQYAAENSAKIVLKILEMWPQDR
ncbi:MAG: 5'-methylthioadenosine/adenosylhomocysteine nucleosidase [Thermofilaceae archaeon]